MTYLSFYLNIYWIFGSNYVDVRLLNQTEVYKLS